jgi:hypothetical protein
MSMTPVGTECVVVDPHGGPKPGGHRLLPERKMAGSLDQSFHEEVIGTFLEQSELDHTAIEIQPGLLIDFYRRG